MGEKESDGKNTHEAAAIMSPNPKKNLNLFHIRKQYIHFKLFLTYLFCFHKVTQCAISLNCHVGGHEDKKNKQTTYI